MSHSELLALARTGMTVRPTSTPEEVEALVRRMSAALLDPVDVDTIKAVSQQLEREFSVRLGPAHTLSSGHKPWLRAKAHEIDFRYWRRYRELLMQQGFGGNVVNRLAEITDDILDLAGDPEKEGDWSRRGLVVGHVQSGKTANYVGVINKAADAGYKLIVLVAGIHSNLRSQTQERVDQGFVGRDSDQVLSRQANATMLGVGEINPAFTAVAYTSRALDFARNRADGLGIPIHNLAQPAIFVIKKNPSILRNLVEWLKGTTANAGRLELPMLVIDDEADNASINISKDPERPNTINRLIRELLSLSTRNTYIGYTATPFANIFVNPDSTDDALGDDLFPRHFIVGLDAPSNYVGAREYFLGDDDNRLTVPLEDTEDWLPTTHKITAEIDALHPSLESAMNCFVLSKAIRTLRGQGSKHHSMLVNVSRFTRVQSRVASLIAARLQSMKDAIENRHASPQEAALRDPYIRSLHSTWIEHYENEPESWPSIQAALHKAAAGMVVAEINASRSSGKLDYRSHEGIGLNVIAVGGNSLSRGFTLEGLTVSYFLRNTQMYDTLLQMGRWFGYRDGYGSICRLFMKPEASDWYAFIAEATEELRDEIARMEAAGLTPQDFGLAVRAHPGSLLVTARNKMKSASQVVRQVGLASRLVESSVLHADTSPREFNVERAERLSDLLPTEAERQVRVSARDALSSILYTGVSQQVVLEFVSAFAVHPVNTEMQAGPLSEYIRGRGFEKWDVVVVSNSDATPDEQITVGGSSIGLQRRSMIKHKNALHVSGTKRRVASRGLEKAGLSDDEITAAVAEHAKAMEAGKAGSTIADHFYRKQRKRPLLMVHFLSANNPTGDKDKETHGVRHAAYGISFPGLREGESERHVAYVVNLVEFRRIYGQLDADGDEEDENDDL
ncbi:Z1 domain-containing protein [Arenimonas malthae]|uniref:Z1 domain-containing protein n=1 Tax=Arenimonas malthae TaxID=354197 RepID=UPI000A0085E4|nr:Z1 domain-containing protein [Arenimonas malthae]